MNEALVVMKESGKVCGNVGSAILAAIHELSHNHQARVALRKRMQKSILLLLIGALCGVLWLRSFELEGVDQSGRTAVHIAEETEETEETDCHASLAMTAGGESAMTAGGGSAMTAADMAEAQTLARLLYGMRKNSERDLRAVCWVVFNRIESPLYPNSLEEVVNQSGQWVSYYPENPATAALTEIAAQELENWRNGENRPFSADTLWFNWSSEGISFRDEF